MNPEPRRVMTDPVLCLAFGFGSGLSPKAPGTLGSLVGLPLILLGLWLGPWGYALLTLAVCLVGVPLCGAASRKLGVHDHGGIVWDEIAGMLISALPLLWLMAPLWLSLLLVFGWFRVFDILKPWPIRLLDAHVHGGLGIMVDDLLAGLFAALAVTLCLHWGAALI